MKWKVGVKVAELLHAQLQHGGVPHSGGSWREELPNFVLKLTESVEPSKKSKRSAAQASQLQGARARGSHWYGELDELLEVHVGCAQTSSLTLALAAVAGAAADTGPCLLCECWMVSGGLCDAPALRGAALGLHSCTPAQAAPASTAHNEGGHTGPRGKGWADHTAPWL